MGERLRTRAALLVLAAAIAAAIGVVASSAHVTRRPELASVDARFSVRGTKRPNPDVVVVGYDGNSRAAHIPFPIPRSLDAQVIDRLRRAGARVIAVDLEFESSRPGEAALQAAIERADRPVLETSVLKAGGRSVVLGSVDGARMTGSIAGTGILPTHGGAVRRVPYSTLGTLSFSVAIAERFAGRSINPAHFNGEGAWIDYAGPQDTVPEISFVDVLRGRVPASALRGKAVIVGGTDQITGDQHATSTADFMPGPEINANAVATILDDFPLRDPAGWVAFLLIVAAGVITPLGALRLSGLRWLPVPLAVAIAYAVGAQVAFDAGTVLPVAAPGLALIVGGLATLTIAYTTDVRQRRRLRAAFARFVPASVVDEVVAQSGGVRLGGTLRDGSVLFCDLRGFTTLTEQIGAPRVIDLLNRYLTEMSDALLEHGGTVVSYMGDGIMAVFGAPLPQENHADRALAAAREMLGPRLDAFNAWLRDEGLTEKPLRMGIGICTGPVMSGNVGSPRRLEYTAVGDTTNTASRLQGMTKDVGVALLVSDATRVALREGSGDLRQVGTLEIRGRSAPIVAWTLSD